MFSVSATIPWPAKAASPWMSKRQNFPPMFHITADSLPGPSGPFNYGIDGLEMAGIRRQTNLDLLAGGQFTHAAVAEVILHVTISRDQIGHIIFGELSEDNFERFAQQIGENVEAAAMRHPHADLLHSRLRASMQNRVEDNH